MSANKGGIGDDIIRIYTHLGTWGNIEAVEDEQPGKDEVMSCWYQVLDSLENSLAYHAQNDPARESNLADKVFMESVRNTVIIMRPLIELADKTWPEIT